MSGQIESSAGDARGRYPEPAGGRLATDYRWSEPLQMGMAQSSLASTQPMNRLPMPGIS